MHQEVRLLNILKLLEEKKHVSNDELCRMLGISRDTARRDIIKLTEQHAAVRTHGGIALPEVREKIKHYHTRSTEASKEKQIIGQYGAGLVKEGDFCFFDVSTTVKEMCRQLTSAFTGYTHSLDNAEVLAQKEQADLHLMGGRFERTHRYFFEPDYKSAISTVKFDKAFLGACGLAEDGVYFETNEDRWIKKAVCERADIIYLMADAGKFEGGGRYKAFDYSVIDVLITDRMPPEKMMSLLRDNQVEVITTME